MKRWKEHFQSLLGNKEERIMERKKNIEISEESLLPVQINERITIEELNTAIKNLKNGKSPGHDRITSEMIKNMGHNATRLFLEICNRTWQKEKIPKEWKIGIILPIHKKGDPKDCNNYRGVTLLSSALKVYEQILDKKLKEYIEPTLAESQSGFRKGRSVQDHIFTLKQIMEKVKQQGNKAYFAFIDLEKAFDSVPRQKLWESLCRREVNDNLIRAIRSLYKSTQNYVIRKDRKSEMFTTTEGVRQGGGLSPTLFNIFMDDIIKICSEKTRKLHVGYRYMQRVDISECAFTDDIVIITASQKDLQDSMRVWNQELLKRGMKLNKNKTKVMAVNSDEEELDIVIEDTKIEQMDHFKYLGVVLQKDGQQEPEISDRIDKTLKLYYVLNKCFINKKEVSCQTKINIFKAIYRPTLTYGCESWVMTKRLKNKIQAVEMKYLRRVRGVTRRDRMRNTQVREDLKVTSILKFIEQRQLSWWGHLQRMNNTRPVKQVWVSRIQKKKKRGRPKETWDSTVGKILKERQKTWTEAQILARNKKAWSKFVHE